jgi:hypothetical protein
MDTLDRTLRMASDDAVVTSSVHPLAAEARIRGERWADHVAEELRRKRCPLRDPWPGLSGNIVSLARKELRDLCRTDADQLIRPCWDGAKDRWEQLTRSPTGHRR